MNVSPILASDTTAAVVPLFVLVFIIVCTGLGLLLGSVTIALNRKLGRRRWWGFVLGTATVLFSVAGLLLSLWIYDVPIIAGFPNYILLPVSSIPLLFGFYALLLWRRFPVSQK